MIDITFNKIMSRAVIIWLMKILPSEIVCIFNDVSLRELDERGWIIWEDDKNNDDSREI